MSKPPIIEKHPKSEADYGPGMTKAHCGICKNFRPPHACKVVQGSISRTAWCKYFAAKVTR